MAEGGKVVSKRSARPYIEDEIEAAGTADPQPLFRTTRHHQDESANFQDRSRQSSTSTSSISQSSRHSSIEAPNMSQVTEKTETAAVMEATSGGIIDAFSMQASNTKLDDSLPKTGRPANFGVVVPGVYRSSFPQAEDHEFIGRLKLKTIVTLVQKDFPEGYDAFIKDNGIKHHVFDMRGTKKERIPDKTMKSILRLVLNQQNHPLLIHCNHGKHRTGCVVAVVRILTGWDVSRVVDEYKSYAEPKVRDCDVEYIQGFEPSAISNLFARDANAQHRFQRAAVFTLVVLLLWMVSGQNMATTPPDEPQSI